MPVGPSESLAQLLLHHLRGAPQRGPAIVETLVTRYGFRVPDVIETMVQLAIAQRVEVRMLEGRDGDSPNRCPLPFWSLARAR